MKSSVIIEIKSRQYPDGGNKISRDSEEELLEFKGEASFRQISGISYISYKENTADSDDTAHGVHSLLKISPSRLEVTKKGDVNAGFHFLAGKVTSGWYHTPFGSLEIRITTKEYFLEKYPDRIRLFLDYRLDRGGQENVRCNMEILIRDAGQSPIRSTAQEAVE